jgi:hypothetical protein
MLAPVGVEYTKEAVIPIKKHITERTAEEITTLLKLLNILIEVNDGKIIRLDIKSAPIILIPKTTVIAVSAAIKALSAPVFVPDAFAKVSSKVTAKILL